jgi:hypothetical protein
MIQTSSTTDSPDEIKRAYDAIGLEVEIEQFTNEADLPPAEPETEPPVSASPTPLTEQQTGEGDLTPEDPDPSAPPTPQEPQKPNKIQARIDELVAERYQRDGRIQELERQLEDLKKPKTPPAEAPAETPAPAAAAPPAPAPKPTPEDKNADGTDKYEGPWDPKFIEAMYDWKAEQREATLLQTIKDLETRLESKDATKTAQQEAEAQHVEFLERGREKHADWDEVAKSDNAKNTNFSPAFFAAMMESEHGPSVMYYLVQHPDEAKSLFDATNHAADATPDVVLRANRVVGRELARIEALAAAPPPKSSATAAPAQPKPKAPSSAPRPIKPVAGAAPATVPTPYEKPMSYAEYQAWWKRTHPDE